MKKMLLSIKPNWWVNGNKLDNSMLINFLHNLK